MQGVEWECGSTGGAVRRAGVYIIHACGVCCRLLWLGFYGMVIYMMVLIDEFGDVAG